MDFAFIVDVFLSVFDILEFQEQVFSRTPFNDCSRKAFLANKYMFKVINRNKIEQGVRLK